MSNNTDDKYYSFVHTIQEQAWRFKLTQVLCILPLCAELETQHYPIPSSSIPPCPNIEYSHLWHEGDLVKVVPQILLLIDDEVPKKRRRCSPNFRSFPAPLLPLHPRNVNTPGVRFFTCPA